MSRRPEGMAANGDIEWEHMDKRRFFLFGAFMFLGARTLIYPAALVKTRLQVQMNTPGQKAAGTLSTFRNVIRTEGFLGLYRGFGTVAIGVLPGQTVYLTVYEMTKAKLGELNRTHNVLDRSSAEIARNFLAGATASVCSQTVVVPLDVVSQRLMVQGASAKVPNAPKYRGGIDAVRQILRSEGVIGLYRGFFASIATYAPSSAIWWSAYSSSKRTYHTLSGLPTGEPVGMLGQVLCGSLAGITSAVTTNPLDVAKTRMQVLRRTKGSPTTMWGTLRDLVAAEGPLSVFKGVSARITSMLPMSIIMIVTYEKLKEISLRPDMVDPTVIDPSELR